MFATYVNDKTIVITSPDKDKLFGLNTTLLKHKKERSKWLNKCFKYVQKGGKMDIVELSEGNIVEDFNDIFMEINYLNLEDPIDSTYMNQMYNLSKVHIFMMYDYHYIPEIPLLTIQGVLIEQEYQATPFDMVEYLETLLDLNFEGDEYL
jgi:hypothetical protein